MSPPQPRIRIPVLLLIGALFGAGCAPIQPLPSPSSDTSSPPPAAPSGDQPGEDLGSFEGPGGYAKPLFARFARGPERRRDQRPTTDEPNTLWDRIREGFKLPDRGHPRVEKYAQQFASQHGRLDQVMAQAEPYLYLIVDAVEERGLPTEIALLPVVESGYNPFANSPSQAAGLWQFLPSTGDLYGLKQNRWYDGRRDVVESTRAALDYLQKLNGDFDGDWLLAIAAYNAGEGTVQRAIEKNHRRGRGADFWSLDLPPSTEEYVPKLLGISAVVEHPEDFGVALRPIPDRPMVKEVQLPGQVNLVHAAELADLSLDDIRRLNACYKRWVTGSGGPHRLLLPVRSAERLKERFLAFRRSETSPNSSAGNGTGILTHRRTETVAQLVDSAEGQDRKLQAARGDGPESDTAPESAYTVKAGDTLWSIATRHHVAVADVRRWNGLRPGAALRVGRELRLAGSGAMGPQLMAQAEAAPDATMTYTVRAGDTIWSIARRFQVDADALQQSNGIQDSGALQAGQTLRIYVDPAALAGG